MISSTARDLPEHRGVVLDACWRQGFFPVMMEHLPACDEDAIAVSLRMVDESQIFLGILAHRYGYVPKGRDISITEMEYNRAGERGIPRLMFVMHEDHAIRVGDVEMGEGAEKLKAFKERAKADKVLRFFKSVDELRSDVIDTLSKLREPNPSPFHYVSDIPAPPELRPLTVSAAPPARHRSRAEGDPWRTSLRNVSLQPAEPEPHSRHTGAHRSARA
jgi:hypothetical protein